MGDVDVGGRRRLGRLDRSRITVRCVTTSLVAAQTPILNLH
jgi:hypothetical protein